MRTALLLIPLAAGALAGCSDPVEGSVPEASNEDQAARLAGVPNGLELEPGVYGGGQPDLATLSALKERGFGLVVNLRQDGESTPAGEDAAVAEAGMRYVHLPISGGEFTLADATLLRAALDTHPEGGGDVLIHCGSGSRVGALYAAMRADAEGMSGAEAVELAKTSGKVRASSLDRLRELLPADE